MKGYTMFQDCLRSNKVPPPEEIKINDLICFLEGREQWTVEDIHLQVILSDLVTFLKGQAFCGDRDTSLRSFQIRLQRLASKDLSSRR